MPSPKREDMQWKRKQLRDISAKKRKEWYSEDKRYRIVWNAEYQGVDLTAYYGALYHAAVRPQHKDETGWCRITPQTKIYRTLKAAQRACDDHKNPPKSKAAKSVRRPRKKRSK